ncbi:hypothetical protein [Streptomyces sp. NPDC059224]|uniref:hypothetical protein n=1 Tax=Streptomyces sp. NPDC059224 TaxID=3346775 RepID=UPI0036B6F5DE
MGLERRGDGRTGGLPGASAGGGDRDAADPGEAGWNCACRLIDGFERLGDCPGDPVGGALCTEETRRLGLWFDEDGDAPELDAGHELLPSSAIRTPV